jgi:type II secretory pathway component PulC
VPGTIASLPTSGGKGSAGESATGADYRHYTLDPDYVEKSVGPGFGKILEAGRLVPYNKDNQMVGFKLINVEPGSLFTKIGLAGGDVITKVNDISMAQPDQGFALYQALQDSREIRVEYLKGGAQPTTLTIDIK